jgi:hypothetical protein
MFSERPFDPDDLPLEAHRTAADQALLVGMTGSAGNEPADRDGRSAARRGLLPFGRRGREAAESRR